MAEHILNRSISADSCAVFPVAELRFALAWSAVAPGFGGWKVAVTHISSGEMIDVFPPGAEFPVFCVIPRTGHVDVIRERPAETGGGQEIVAQPPTLRDALLLLCPLGPGCIAEIDRQHSGTDFLIPGWG